MMVMWCKIDAIRCDLPKMVAGQLNEKNRLHDFEVIVIFIFNKTARQAPIQHCFTLQTIIQ